MEKWIARGLMFLSVTIGGSSLVAFGFFLYDGPFVDIPLAGRDLEALLLDIGLSLLFFIQHSTMVRPSFRQRISNIIPEHYQGTVYAIVSGFFLWAVLLFWQKSMLFSAEVGRGMFWGLRLVFFAAAAGFLWGTRALDHFDGLGLRSVAGHLHKQRLPPVSLAVKGPYRWVRHPLYLFTIIMIWAAPFLTADRLLFNCLWTLWIILGCFLEERDLVQTYGTIYKKYQSEVPMLIPVKKFW